MIALQKLIMTLKINHIHMKKQHNIPKSLIPKPHVYKGESHEKEKTNHHNNSSHYTLHYYINIRH